MKPSKKDGLNQRTILERKIQPWLSVREDRVPPSGWLKAIRGALGINTRQLADRLGVKHSAIIQFETREAQGKVSIESIRKLARAMQCKFVYAVVPESPFSNLDSILEAQAIQAARSIVNQVDQTMQLEQQQLPVELSQTQVRELAKQLKESMDKSLWNVPQSASGKRKKP
jgi:predicted DNA-binding mobile mystery protein A